MGNISHSLEHLKQFLFLILYFKIFGDICRGWEPYIIVEVSLSHGCLYILPFYINENIKSQTITQRPQNEEKMHDLGTKL